MEASIVSGAAIRSGGDDGKVKRLSQPEIQERLL